MDDWFSGIRGAARQIGTELRGRRGQIKAAVDSLNLEPDWTVRDLVEAVERKRGRPVQLVDLPWELPAEICALWAELRRGPHEVLDVVFVRRSADPLLDWWSVTHEFGHMVLEHGDDGGVGLRRKLSPSVSDRMVDKLNVILRHSDIGEIDAADLRMARGMREFNSDELEYRAELFAEYAISRARWRGRRRVGVLKGMSSDWPDNLRRPPATDTAVSTIGAPMTGPAMSPVSFRPGVRGPGREDG